MPHVRLGGTRSAARTGWVAPGDGLLAVDKNGNGRIDDYTELFGNDAQDGFIARMRVGIRSANKSVLAGYDTNNDGRVDAADITADPNDVDWADLRLWRDADCIALQRSSSAMPASNTFPGFQIEPNDPRFAASKTR